MSERLDPAPSGKPSQCRRIEVVELVCWRGELATLLLLLQISKADFERGLKGKTGIRREGALTKVRVELRNNAPLFAALQRKLQEGASDLMLMKSMRYGSSLEV